jgi:hypothetical protein
MNRDAHQFKDWFDINKDNFKNSFSYPSCSEPHFLESDLVRFGKLHEIRIDNGNCNPMYISGIPKGTQVYHSSRSIVVNNSVFPIPGYDQSDPDASRDTEKGRAIERMNVIRDTGEWDNMTTNSYYSARPENEYLHKDTKFLGDQIRYSYGYDTLSSPNDSLSDGVYNDRAANKANDYNDGVSAYETKKEYTYLLAMPDIFFLNRKWITLSNLSNIFFCNAEQGDEVFMNNETWSAAGMSLYSNIAVFYNPTEGQTPAQRHMESILYFSTVLYNIITSIIEGVNRKEIMWGCLGTCKIIISAYEYHLNTTVPRGDIRPETFTEFLIILFNNGNGEYPGYTDDEIKGYYQGKSIIPGVRMSTYEMDRPFHTYVRSRLESVKIPIIEKEVREMRNIEGIVGGYSYNPRWTPNLEIKDGYYVQASVSGFHSEIILFYAPDTLEESERNDYSYNRGFNYGGILSEMRKYKTTNILHSNLIESTGFHQGHLYEHSVWTSLHSLLYAKQSLDTLGISEKVFAMAGIIHDIGKAGICGFDNKPVWAAYNSHEEPKVSSCIIVSNNIQSIGFIYSAIPEHPERGYMYLSGLIPFNMSHFTNGGSNISGKYKLTLVDWKNYMRHNGITEEDQKYIRISTGMHWDLGPIVGKILSDGNYDEHIMEFLKRFELFYNNEFPIFSLETFRKALFLTMIVSYADISASLYHNELNDSKEFGIRNELPNYNMPSLNDIIFTIINVTEKYREAYNRKLNRRSGDEINKEELLFKLNERDFKDIRNVVLADAVLVSIQQESTLGISLPQSKKYAINIQENIKKFYTRSVELYNSVSYRKNPNYTFSTLNSIVEGMDVYMLASYYNRLGKFPKVLIFDLDETLFHMFTEGNSVLTTGEYSFVRDLDKIMTLAQKLRSQFGVYIAVATRHYTPALLLPEKFGLNSKGLQGSSIHPINVDIFVSQYTGSQETLEYAYNGGFTTHSNLSPEEMWNSFSLSTRGFGFTTRNVGKNRTVNDWTGIQLVDGTWDENDPKYQGTEKTATKIDHMEKIMEYTGAAYEEMILFDDSSKYYKLDSVNRTLGGNVFTAGLRKDTDYNGGLTFELFEQAIKLFVFNKFM